MDELELLQEHFDEVPVPSQEFVNRVRGRLIDSIDDDDGPGPRSRVSHPPTRRLRMATIAAVAASLILVAAAVAVFSSSGNGSLHGGTALGSWRLAGFVVAQSGSENAYGPTSGFLTCPTSSICYDASPQISQVGSSYVAGKSVLFATSNDGTSWVGRDLPAGVTLTTALQCVSDEECALGATGPGPGGTTTAQILTTTDGGSSWISHDLPAGIGSLYLLSCPSLGACSGLASPAVSHLASTFVETHDGGASWSQYAFSEDQAPTSISCASSNQCLVVGDEPSTSPGSSGYGVSWTTDDGGQSWHSDVTKGFSLGVAFGQGNLSCPTSNMCMANAVVSHQVSQCSAQAAAASAAAGTTCQCPPDPSASGASTGSTCTTGQDLVSEPATTTDGGRTWALESFPSDIPRPMIFDVECTTPDLCWAAGSENVPNQSVIGGLPSGSGSSPVVLMSRDGGITWATHTFAVPSALPAGETLSAIDQIQCQSTGSCVALGLGVGGAAHTLVYTFDG